MPTKTPISPKKKSPVSGKFTPRDGQILEAIHAYDGMLADYQLRALFFTGESQFRLRMRYLSQHGYVSRPTYKERAAIRHMVYWLSKQGAAYVAGKTGTPVEEFTYLKTPRWSQLDHDIAVNDVRLAFTNACRDSHNTFAVSEWIPQSEFYSDPDKVDYQDAHGRTKSRLIRPDAYIILDHAGKPYRFLLELDMATESNVRFGREKVLPGLAYLRSAVYEKRFGHRSGRFLIVTTSDRKLTNLKRQTELVAGKDAKQFYFTTLAGVKGSAILTDAIWYRGGEEAKGALFRQPPHDLPETAQERYGFATSPQN